MADRLNSRCLSCHAFRVVKRSVLNYVASNESPREEMKLETPIDPVLFAASVPSHKPTAKDIADAKERPDDAIEPRKYASMDKMV
jgi:hypothetical protein